MKSKKNSIINTLLFIILIILTYSLIFKNNFKETYNQILSLNIIYIIISIILMFLYFLIESYNIKKILNSLKEKITLKNALKYTFIGFLFSSITPAATGGEPMEIYYMSKDNIKLSNATLTLLIYLCGHHIAAVSIGIISMFLNYKLFNNNIIILFIIGNLLNTIPITLTLIGIFKENFIDKLLIIISKLLTCFKVKKKNKILEKLTIEINNYKESTSFIKNNKKIFIKAIIISYIHEIVYYMIPFFIYKSFNLNGISILKFIELNSILHSTVCSIPLPGSVGANESVFILIYNKIYGNNLVKSAMLVNRFITFYIFVILSFIVFIINKIKIKKNIHELN